MATIVLLGDGASAFGTVTLSGVRGEDNPPVANIDTTVLVVRGGGDDAASVATPLARIAFLPGGGGPADQLNDWKGNSVERRIVTWIEIPDDATSAPPPRLAWLGRALADLLDRRFG